MDHSRPTHKPPGLGLLVDMMLAITQTPANHACTRQRPGKDLGAHAALLQIRGDSAFYTCLDIPLGSEEMLLEMSGDKFTWVGL